MINTKLAQKVLSIKGGLLTLVFTLVFLSMGVDSHAQQAKAQSFQSPYGQDVSILASYDYSMDANQVEEILSNAKVQMTNRNETYAALRNAYVGDVLNELNDGGVSVETAFYKAFYKTAAYASRYNLQNDEFATAVKDVVSLIN